MDQIREFVDQRQKGWCIHCGGWITDIPSNRDHAPSKSLLVKHYPANLPIVEVCVTCNNGFSRDEEYLAAFLSAVLSGSTECTAQRNPAAARILGRSEALRKRIERSKSEYKTVGGETRVLWKPEQDRINRVVVKNARGHASYNTARRCRIVRPGLMLPGRPNGANATTAKTHPGRLRRATCSPTPSHMRSCASLPLSAATQVPRCASGSTSPQARTGCAAC